LEIYKIDNPFLSDSFYNKTLKPLLDIQEQNNTLLRSLISSQASWAIETLASLDNRLIAQALDGLLVIRHDVLEQIGGGAFLKSLDWLAKDIGNVTQAFTQVFRDQIQELKIPNFAIIDPKTSDRFILPPRIVASYTSSTRDFLRADFITDMQPLPSPERGLEELGDQELDTLLYQLNPIYIKIRQGAWLALRQPNPDRLRHAATSQRELMRQLIVQLVPDTKLPEEDKGGTRLRARLKVAFGTSDSNAEFVESVSAAVVSLYDQLNKYTHHNEKHEESLRALMHTSEGLIRFILSLLPKK
jgi:hypothetical protein